MPSLPIKIILNGKTRLHSPTTNRSTTQCANIENLAKFIFDNSDFLELTHEIFLRCIQSPFDETYCDALLKLHENEYSSAKFSTYTLLLKKLYTESSQIDNDRGCVLEKICEFAIRKKYGKLKANIQFHCQVSLEYEKIKISLRPKDIDVCAELSCNGDYLESKRGLHGESQQDNNKMLALSELTEQFGLVKNKFGLINDLKVFVFTNSPTKLSYYKSKWPLINFLNISLFSSTFLS